MLMIPMLRRTAAGLRLSWAIEAITGYGQATGSPGDLLTCGDCKPSLT
ncbi:mCG1044286, isoform CRA_a [Mus musculus]|nr:mCG1044286, isoform CRA_a [Mus musculus]EDL31959.1 mCG1044286, isoform CRA_a [Mus musculus]